MSQSRQIPLLLILALSLLVAGCGGGGGGSSEAGGSDGGNPGVPSSIAKVAGDNQIGAPGFDVPTDPTVRVTDTLGNAVANVVVHFAVIEGGGSIWSTVGITNEAGHASCGEWRLGKAKGPNSVSATVEGLSPVMFDAVVDADVLLELGHADEIVLLRISGDRVLSQDSSGHWTLWDYASGSIVADGGALMVDLAGSTLVVGGYSGFQVRAASNGHTLSTSEGPNSWWKLASDGSYVCAGSSSNLSAWTPTGELLLRRAGDYSEANIFAAPHEIRVALGPAGGSVIETIDIETGASNLGPAFNGQFHSWFTDGERFLTNVAYSVWVYSNATLQQGFFSYLAGVYNLGGQGNWIWDGSSIYAVDGNGTPAATYPETSPLGTSNWVCSGTTIGILGDKYSATTLSVVDLSGSTPTKQDFADSIHAIAYAATSSSQWLIGGRFGVVLDGPSLASEKRLFSLGEAMGIAGGGDRVAIATTQKTLYLDVLSGAIEGQIEIVDDYPKIEMSNDGTILACMYGVGEPLSARNLTVFSLPSGGEVRTWIYPNHVQPYIEDFSLSGSGTYMGQVLDSGLYAYDQEVLAISGSLPTWTNTMRDCHYYQPIRISPNGSLIGVATACASFPSLSIPCTSTNIFRNGAFSLTIPGWPVGWVDDNRILLGICGNPAAYWLYDSSGMPIVGLNIPEINSFQTVTSDSIYSPEYNTIYSLTTGEATWSSGVGTFGRGAVAGSRVVFAYGSRILSQEY